MRYIVISLILALVFSHLYSLNPLTQIIGDGGDNYEYFGFQHLVKQNILAGTDPLAKTNTFRYPDGFDLSYGYDGVFAVFTGAFLGLILPQPVAYNLTLVAILFVNIWLSFLFFNKLIDLIRPQTSGEKTSELLPWISTIIFALSPYVFARLNAHLNLALVGGLPLLGYALLNIYEKVKLKKLLILQDIFLLTLGLSTIAFGSLQYLILLSYNGLIFSLLFALIYSEKISLVITEIKHVISNNFNSILISLFGFILILVVFYSGYFQAILSGNFTWVEKAKSYNECCQPVLSDIFFPNQYIGTFWKVINPSAASIEKVISPGIFEIFVLILLLAKMRKKKITVFFLLYILVSLPITLGWIHLPYFPENGRQFLIVVFLIAVYYLFTLQKQHKVLLSIILTVFLLQALFYELHISPLFPNAASAVIQKQKGTAVLNIPLNQYDAYYSTLPYYYHKKIVDGYFHFTANTKESQSFIQNSQIQSFVCQLGLHIDSTQLQTDNFRAIYAALVSNDIRTIVVHKNRKFYFEECKNVRTWWYNLNPPTITVNESTATQQIIHKELTGLTNLSLRFYFAKAGTFSLEGLNLYPASLQNARIALPSGEQIPITWDANQSESLTATLKPAQNFIVNAGDAITLFSDTQIDEPIYVGVWYNFLVSNSSISVKPPFEKLYKDNDIEVYQLN